MNKNTEQFNKKILIHVVFRLELPFKIGQLDFKRRNNMDKLIFMRS